MAQANLPVPFRSDGPPLLFEFDDVPEIKEDGTYLDEEPPAKRKRVDGDEDEINRNRRATAGAKGKAGIVRALHSPSPAPLHPLPRPLIPFTLSTLGLSNIFLEPLNPLQILEV